MLATVNLVLGSCYLVVLLVALGKAYLRIWACWHAKQHWCGIFYVGSLTAAEHGQRLHA